MDHEYEELITGSEDVEAGLGALTIDGKYYIELSTFGASYRVEVSERFFIESIKELKNKEQVLIRRY